MDASSMRTAAHRSRIGRRMIALFILSALIPLTLCAAFLLQQFTRELVRTQEQSLNDLVRNFGMNLLGRLNGADDVVEAVVRTHGATDQEALEAVAKLQWVRSVRRVKWWEPLADSAQGLPLPSEPQRRALQDGRPAIVSGTDEGGTTQIYLLRRLPSKAWLYAEIADTWLWSDTTDYAGRAYLAVLDGQGELLSSAGTVPAALMRAVSHAAPADRTNFTGDSTATPEKLPSGWMSRSWELFLRGRYSSPSWRLVALSERPRLFSAESHAYPYLFACLLMTILTISWLSLSSIRRQLQPLDLLTQAATRVAQRDFEAFRGMSWNDEFGDLARTFDGMSTRLRVQFTALETLAEVDRLLLSTPQLELILDTLLPRIAGLLSCDTVSVLLFDPTSNEHARSYDYDVSQGEHLPLRRIAVDIAALKALCMQPSLPLMEVTGTDSLAAILPAAGARIAAFRLRPLKLEGECVGALCIGYATAAGGREATEITSGDFADRLSLILANLKQAEGLRHQANFDSLTGLQNRQLFSDHVRTAVASAEAARGRGSLLYIDLDQFKRVNDTAGHAAGDRLLQVVAARLTACLGEGHSIARLGGDEFAVLLPAILEPDNARRVAERILVALKAPILIEGREHSLSASIGMAVFPDDGTKLEQLLKAGDIAMYHAKDNGRGQAVFFQSEMQQTLIERIKLEEGMQWAFNHDEFALHYQPIVSEVGSGSIAVEALLRWHDGTEGPISPGVFIPVAEENGLIVKLGEWVLRSACEQFARWRSAGLALEYVSVNVSVRQLREPGYLRTLLGTLKDNGMQGHELQVEITESVLGHADLAHGLAEIAAHGVRLALDDFGTGYSSLSYLRSYPIHAVKIDRSFVLGLPHDVTACRLAESIIVMCAVLGKSVIAEGVETEEQRQFLRRAGCSTVQGYLLGRPMEASDIPGFARRLRSVSHPQQVTDGADAPQAPRASAS